METAVFDDYVPFNRTSKSMKLFADPMDILRALPANIVAVHIYDFAVRVFTDRHKLMEAVDRYCDDDSDDNRDNNRRRYPISQWDVERVRNFSRVFNAERNPTLKNFNEDLSKWNVVNGTKFYGTFYGCKSFNSDVSGWNVGKATTLSYMFCFCDSFASNVSGWNVANTDDFSYMFY
jgi:surface protein